MYVKIYYTRSKRLDGKILIWIFDIRNSCSEPLNVASEWFIRTLHHRPKTSQSQVLLYVSQKMSHKSLLSYLKLVTE